MDANGNAGRSGTLTIAGLAFTVTQDGAVATNTPAGLDVHVPLLGGGITVAFASVLQAGVTVVQPSDPCQPGDPCNAFTRYRVLAGLAFDVSTSATTSGPITLTFDLTRIPPNPVTPPNPIIPPNPVTPQFFATLRVLHGENGVLTDRTVLIPTDPCRPSDSAQTICASVNSLSPFALVQLAPYDVLGSALVDLLAVRQATTERKKGRELDAAIDALTQALDPALWVDTFHLRAPDSDDTFDGTRRAVGKLTSWLTDADLQRVVDEILGAVRELARVAVGRLGAMPGRPSPASAGPDRAPQAPRSAHLRAPCPCPSEQTEGDMHQSLDGQAALVTGAGSGIGAGVARALGAAGASVIVNYVSNPDAAEAVAEDVRGYGVEAVAIQADVSNETEVREMFAKALARIGPVDILVNNAGLQQDAPFTEMTVAQWNTVLGVNLTGMFLCAREAAREMIRRGPRPELSAATGKIICISSVHEVIPWAGHVNYAASKGGVSLFMRSLAQELAPHRIRVNSVAPGAIQTPINRPAWETPEALGALLKLIPYGRIGQPQDIGRVVVWLASDDADYVHGQTIFVDGGMTLYPAFAQGG